MQALGLKGSGGQAQVEGGRGSQPSSKYQEQVHQQQGCLAFSSPLQGTPNAPGHCMWPSSRESSHLAPKTSRAAGTESVNSADAVKTHGSHQECGGVQGKACGQFECRNCGRLLCPQPAPFLDPISYVMERRTLRAAIQILRNHHRRRPLLQEEALPLPQVKTANLKHIFSIKYLTSLKVINMYCSL